MKFLNKIAIILCFLGITSVTSQVQTIKNGITWRDTDGNRIQAHSSDFFQHNNKFYLLGIDRSQNFQYKRFNLYVSDDLMNWEFLNTVINKDSFSEEDDPITPGEGKYLVERSHMVYNETTEKFLIWSKYKDRDNDKREVAIFSSSTIDGTYQFEKSFLPAGFESNDCNIFKDDDGKLYFVSNGRADDPSAGESMNIYLATDDFLGVERKIVSLFPNAKKEAPVLFKNNGIYYLIFSHKSGWRPNQGQYAYSTSLESGWSDRIKFANSNTYDTQPTDVLTLKNDSGNSLFYYLGDRHQDPSNAESKNILLPMTVNNGALSLEYVPEFTIDIPTGTWTSQDSDTYIPQDNWSLVSVSSQSKATGQNAAVSAFDGDLSTHWFTGNVEPNHELVIDLGATYDVSGFLSVPRQDKSVKGIIRDFQLFLSTDGINWNAPAAAGWLGYYTKVFFKESIMARYVRIVGTTSANIGGGTLPFTASISELKLLTNNRYQDGGITVSYNQNGEFLEYENTIEVSLGDEIKFFANGYSLNEEADKKYGSFSWHGPNGFYDNSRNPSITITDNNQLGDYIVYFLDDSFSVQKQTVSITSNTLSVRNVTLKQNMYLYPNPVNNGTIHIYNGLTNTAYKVYDITGKQVLKDKGSHIDVSTLLPGFYIAVIGSKNFKFTIN